MRIRAETPDDAAAIAAVNREAFGQENESRLVESLRSSDAFLPELSRVAVLDGRIVGHILFTRIAIRTERGQVPALALAPMAVVPEHQRQGIGSALVREGLETARKQGHAIVIVLGHPDYYPRFGFIPAATYGIRPPFEAPSEAFLACALQPGALEGIEGVVEYSPPFDAV